MIISYVLNIGAELLGKKWRAVVIWYLKDGPKRFSELKRDIPEVSVKVLSEVLKEMEANKLVIRTQYNTIPVKVEYSIDPAAQDIIVANIACTVSLTEYAIRNANRLEISEEMDQDLRQWLDKYNKLSGNHLTGLFFISNALMFL